MTLPKYEINSGKKGWRGFVCRLFGHSNELVLDINTWGYYNVCHVCGKCDKAMVIT